MAHPKEWQIPWLPEEASHERAGDARANRRASANVATPLSDIETYRRALEYDPKALRELVDALTPVVQSRVARVLLRRADAATRTIRQEVEDLTQEVFAALFDQNARALRGWEPERGLGLYGFVGLLAERHVITILRTRHRSPFSETPTEERRLFQHCDPCEVSPEAHALSRRELEVLLDRMTEELSVLGVHIFDLIWCQRKPIETICKELHMTADAVYAWKSRITKLARRLADEERRSPHDR